MGKLRQKPNNTCGWCGLEGHYEPTCHVKARGERAPDVYDERACALVRQASSQGERASALTLRQLIAAELRQSARERG